MNVCERVVKSLLLDQQEIAVLSACFIFNNINPGCIWLIFSVWAGAERCLERGGLLKTDMCLSH